jgi:hypothetical protein
VFLAVVFVGIVVLGVVSLASSSTPVSPGSGCVQNDYGTQCVALVVRGQQVTGLAAQLTWLTDVFDQHAWTFETTTYACDPRGKTKHECAPTHTVYGSLQPRTPHGTSDLVCTTAGDAPPPGSCRGTFNVPMPTTFAGARWLCEELAVRVQGAWVSNGAGIPEGTRGCRRVS